MKRKTEIITSFVAIIFISLTFVGLDKGFGQQKTSKISSSIEMTPWRDPNEGAFTISIPKGWSVNGGLVRPYIDAGIKIVVTHGDRGIHIENPFPPFYITPNWTLNMSGFAEGSRYNLSPGLAQDMVVMRERNAADYIQAMLLPYLKFDLKDIRPRPDIASRFIKTPVTAQTTAAEATLFGDGKIHKIIVVEQSMYAAETGLWSVSLVHYWAPIDELPGTEDIVGAMASSFKIDPMWLKREEMEVAKRVGFINKAGSEVADIIRSVFDYQCRIQDRAHRQWSDAMMGVKEVYNPKTGESYNVPSEAAHYWSDGYNVVGTETHEPPTYNDDWTELLPAEQ